ncbi:hypothetical protein Tco_0400635 [Tanacetum coccineum]
MDSIWKLVFLAQDEPTEFALMAYTLNSSGFDTEVQSCSKNCVKAYEKLQKQFDEQRQTLSKANLEVVAYQLGLESVEAQLVVHQKKEAVYKKKIAVLEFKVKDKRYGDQLNENDSSGSELFNSIFDIRSSDAYDNQTNDKPTTNKTSASVSQVEANITPPSDASVEMPRVESIRPTGVIFEDDFLTDYQDIDGGFVAFDGSARGGPQELMVLSYKSSDEKYKNVQLMMLAGVKLLYKKPASENDNSLKEVLDNNNRFKRSYKNIWNLLVVLLLMVDLDTYNSPFADQVMGAEVDFNNMEPSTVQEPTKIAQALDDESWVEAMQEELL